MSGIFWHNVIITLPVLVITAVMLAGIVVANILAIKVLRQSERSYVLVNNNMGMQLRLTANALRRLAQLTKDELDVKAADHAERLYDEHMGQQAIVNGGG